MKRSVKQYKSARCIPLYGTIGPMYSQSCQHWSSVYPYMALYLADALTYGSILGQCTRNSANTGPPLYGTILGRCICNSANTVQCIPLYGTILDDVHAIVPTLAQCILLHGTILGRCTRNSANTRPIFIVCREISRLLWLSVYGYLWSRPSQATLAMIVIIDITTNKQRNNETNLQYEHLLKFTLRFHMYFTWFHVYFTFHNSTWSWINSKRYSRKDCSVSFFYWRFSNRNTYLK